MNTESPDHLGSPVNSLPAFARLPGETPRAFGAFITFFQLGHARSLQAVADKLGEGLPTVKNWASKYDWSERILAFDSGVLAQQARDHAILQCRRAADWATRLDRFREQEWDAAQKLLAAAQCFLESFGEEDLRNMTLAQVSRALRISSGLGRSALAGAQLAESSAPSISPAQQQLLDSVQRIYGQGRASTAVNNDPPSTFSSPAAPATAEPAKLDVP